MPLRGDLQSIDLAEVFRALTQGQRVGTLTIEGADSPSRYVYFAPEGISLLVPQGSKLFDLESTLKSSGWVQARQLAEIREKAAAPGQSLASILIAAGLVPEADLERLIQSRVEDALLDLFSWKQAHFEFTDGPPPKDLVNASADLAPQVFDTNHILIEAARHLDEWDEVRRVLQDMGRLVGRVDGVEPGGEPSEVESGVMLLADGSRSAAEIASASFCRRLETFQAVRMLLTQGVLRFVPKEEIRALAMQSLEGGDPGRSIRLLRHALEGDPRDAEACDRVVPLLLSSGEPAEAAAVLRAFGNAKFWAGARADAATAFRAALKCVPDDADIECDLYEAILPDLLVGPAYTEALRIEGKLLSNSRFPVAYRVWELFRSHFPERLDAVLHLADILLLMKQRQEAIALLVHTLEAAPNADPRLREPLQQKVRLLKPAREGVPHEPLPESPSDVAVPSVPGRRILVVDDDPSILLLVQAALQAAAYEVELAGSAAEGFLRYLRFRPDLVLLDIDMPGRDGFHLCSQIREREMKAIVHSRHTSQHSRETPVLFLTGSRQKEDILQAARLGARGYVVKPYEENILLEKIAATLREADAVPSSGTKAEPAPAGATRLRPEIARLVPEYLARRIEDLAKIQQALDIESWEQIERIGHNMKGSGTGYGFPEISNLGGELERRAKLREADSVRSAILRLKSLVEDALRARH